MKRAKNPEELDTSRWWCTPLEQFHIQKTCSFTDLDSCRAVSRTVQLEVQSDEAHLAPWTDLVFCRFGAVRIYLVLATSCV